MGAELLCVTVPAVGGQSKEQELGSCVVLGLWAGAIAPLWPGWRPREGCGPAKVAWLLPEQFVRMWGTGQWGLRGTLV